MIGHEEELLTVKELAEELRMSLKSIQRAYRNAEIPVQWLGRMARFNLAKLQRAMERNGRSRMLRLNNKSTLQGAIAGHGQRRAPQTAPVLANGGGISTVSHGGLYECLEMLTRLVSLHRAGLDRG